MGTAMRVLRSRDHKIAHESLGVVCPKHRFTLAGQTPLAARGGEGIRSMCNWGSSHQQAPLSGISGPRTAHRWASMPLPDGKLGFTIFPPIVCPLGIRT